MSANGANGNRCACCGGDISTQPCGCCEGVQPITPASTWNPPGLSAINYRVGTYGQFRETMLTGLAGQPSLMGLTTRADDDLAIGILDSWAAVGDVLSFYQERIANEGYLRTATERLSVLQLAREIGYELGPGVAASAYLAFTLDTSGSVASTLIDVGTKVQSVPLQGKTPPELPQTFEAVEPIIAYPELNSMTPNPSTPQVVVSTDSSGATHYQIYDQGSRDLLDFSQFLRGSSITVILLGTNTKLKNGDKLLFLAVSESTSSPLLFATVTDVSPLKTSPPTTQVTISVEAIEFGPAPASPKGSASSTTSTSSSSSLASAGSLTTLDSNTFMDMISGVKSQSDLTALLARKGWNALDFAHTANAIAAGIAATSVPNVQVLAFRVATGVFGDVSPAYVLVDSTNPSGGLEKNPWGSTPIDQDSGGHPYSPTGRERIFLDSMQTGILPGSWVVLQGKEWTCATDVTAVVQQSLADFAISAKVTGLDLDLKNALKRYQFHIQDTTVYAQSEQLQLAPVPDMNSIQSDSIVLDLIYPTLQVNQTIVVTGELAGQPGQYASEVVSIASIDPFSGGALRTKIGITPQLVNSYTFGTVTINGNVALATHGETKNEVVGSGDPTQPYLEFSLKQKPLTYVRPIPPASSPTGGVTTLQVWVDDIKWTEAPSLYGLAQDARSYIVRRDDDGTINVLFGNARPALGIENITAQYRVGTGLDGMVQAGQLSLLVSRPLGVNSVTNPLAADGAGDPEDRDHARENAPITVLTLDRIVSLTDVQNFALALSGVGKALAQWSWMDGRKVVTLYVASSIGQKVVKGSALYKSLCDGISQYKDPSIEVTIDETFREIEFGIQGTLIVGSDRDPDAVRQAVVLALQQAFSFAARQIGKPVHFSDVVGVIQGVDGVVAVEIKQISTQSQSSDPLTCGLNELLIINPDPDGISLDTRMPS